MAETPYSQRLTYARRFPDKCVEEVSRAGTAEPCNKGAVAVRRDPEHGYPYPVCAFHARGDMVPLSDLLAASHLEGTATQ